MGLMTSCSDDDDAKPAGITIEATETTEHTIKVTFNEVADALFYDIEFGKKGETLEYVESSTILSFDFDELKAGTDYTIKITAINSNGKEIGEGTIDITTKDVLSTLVGEWKYTYNDDEEKTIIYHFDEDGFGTYKYFTNDEQIIMWSASDDQLTITTYTSQVGGISSTEEVSYIVYPENGMVKIDDTTYFFME
ncbi:fibronectin type III domain-containing protein [Saccharicrinis fermentans]|uniref:Fibronectin type III domain protein n=2 Tax=Saccharicrinis fermentans TaxID=982 RepID=W7YFW8_9BACT|nr:fibronectin type III domain-containing protein [Saccharicrinis fermentans]GAF03346.1 fibronectin type III domain protein [Saccharicrinis fermentans DSM 9555 = JCM 21142]